MQGYGAKAALLIALFWPLLCRSQTQKTEVSDSESSIRDLIATAKDLEFANTRQAYNSAVQAAEKARHLHDPTAELEALLLSGKTARYLNDYPAAESAAISGLALSSTLKAETARGNFYLLLGYIKWNQADLPAAISALLEAEKISRAEKNIPLQISVQSTLGLVDARNDNPQGSLSHLTNALDLAEHANDPQLCSILNNIGSHYLGLKDYEKACGYYQRALPLARNSDNRRLLAFLLVNLGQIAVEQDDLSSADQYLAEALAISEQFDIRRGTADVYYLRGIEERRRHHFDVSRSWLEKSLALARELNNPDLFAIIYTELAATEEGSGRYKEALGYTRNYSEQKEIIRGEKSRQLAAQLTAQYDAETRAHQIKLLKRDRELAQADLKLKDAELSRAHARYMAVALILVLGGLAASAVASRQRARAHKANRMLEATRAAKEQFQEADANKARLLTIATQSLRDSEARFRAAFEFSPLGMALVALDGRWIRVNPALCQITGYSESELLAIDFQAITHPDDLTPDLIYVQRLLGGEIETYQMEKRYIHKSGHLVWVRLDVALIREPETQKPQAFISQVQDITARRRDEEQLHHAKEEAERANAAKSEFLSRMSHELRTPLNAILGFGQLLEIQDLGSKSNQSVGQILSASRHLLELINEVLDISAIESGRFAMALEPTSAGDTLQSVTDLVLPLAEQANIRLSADRKCPGCILADPRRLKQVLLNLLSNAIKYNRIAGEVVLSCEANDGRLRIEVSDTGLGIAASDLETIFVPFARLPAAHSVAGTGLGLSLCRVLTEAMGGTLGVNSEVGRGSTFWLEFALLPADTPCSPPALEFDPVATGFFEPDLTQSATVLYIEDNPTNFELVKQLLESQPEVKLLSASTGRLGLKMAAEYAPNLILLDMQLPEMSGSEVLRRLRTDPALAKVPVIVLSAEISGHERKRMERLGIRCYITKPFDLAELRQAIKDGLSACVSE